MVVFTPSLFGISNFIKFILKRRPSFIHNGSCVCVFRISNIVATVFGRQNASIFVPHRPPLPRPHQRPPSPGFYGNPAGKKWGYLFPHRPCSAENEGCIPPSSIFFGARFWACKIFGVGGESVTPLPLTFVPVKP